MAFLSPEALHALQMAIQNEQDMVQIYQHMLKHVNNSKTGEMLRGLIEEENNHQVRMKELVKTAGGEHLQPELDLNTKLPNKKQLMEIELDNFTVSELINLAIENERISRDFYLAQYHRARDETVKNVFKWLVDQEEVHIGNLQKENDAHPNYEEVRLSDKDLNSDKK